jgi:N-acetylglutamate synthase-like GNAT family acetyltransferase
MSLIEYRLRAATSDDHPRIRRVIRQARLNPLGVSWRTFIIAEDSNETFLGCAQIKLHKDGTQELASIYVHPAYRNQGIATEMIRELQGRSQMELWLTCRSSLGAFYAQFGFIEVTKPREMPPYFNVVWRLFRIIGCLVGVRGRLAVMKWKRSEGVA